MTDEPFLEHTEKGDVWVYPARINCNLKSQVLLRGGVGGSARASERERDRDRDRERERESETDRERQRETERERESARARESATKET